MKTIIEFLGLKHEITQFKFGRKLYGGTWYLIWNWLNVNHYFEEEWKRWVGLNNRAISPLFYYSRIEKKWFSNN